MGFRMNIYRNTVRKPTNAHRPKLPSLAVYAIQPTHEGTFSKPSYETGDVIALLKIEGIALPGGQGLAKLPSGMTVLVEGALPGEQVRARVTSVKKTSLEAGVVESLSPPDFAVQPRCEYEQHCGGCILQRIDYTAQLDLKRRHVSEALTRNGGLERELAASLVAPTVASPEVYGYRNKVEFSFSTEEWDPVTDRVLSVPQLALGFHRRGSKSAVLAVKSCALQDDVSNRILDSARTLCTEAGLAALPVASTSPAAGPRTFGLTHLTIRKGSVARGNNPEYMAVLSSQGPVSPPIAAKLQQIADRLVEECPGIVSVVHCEEASHPRAPPLATRVLYGKAAISETLLGEVEFEISPASFFQTNPYQAQNMYRLAKEFANLQPGESLLDLYCGTGTFALAIAKGSASTSKLVGVDISASSIRDARMNAERNGISNATFLEGNLEDPAVAQRLRSADVIVVDPARAGLSGPVVQFLRSSKARAVVYVSCSPPTFARDVKELTARDVRPTNKGGYQDRGGSSGAKVPQSRQSRSTRRRGEEEASDPQKASAAAASNLVADVPFVLKKVIPLDMFPHTGHCELVALLERR